MMSAENTFRIAVLGAFSGDSRCDGPRDIRPIQIDRDNFDAVMSRLEVRLEGLQLLPETAAETLTFRKLEDFHPDRLFERLEVFSTLRSVREQLQAPETSLEALRLVERWMSPAATEPGTDKDAVLTDSPAREETANAEASTQPASVPSDNLLDSILDRQASQAPVADGNVTADNDTAMWQSYIASIVAPHAEAGPHPAVSDAVQWLDTTIQSLMQRVLALPKFRQLEARWRALHLLVHRLETGPDLKVFLFDIDRSRLQAELSIGVDHDTDIFDIDLTSKPTPLIRALVTETVDTQGGEPWSLLVGDFYFGIDDNDLPCLARLAQLAEATQTPFIAGADLSRFADVSNADWQRLRHSSSGGYIGLVWPRVLTRLPYGPNTRPIESFAFDELSGVERPSQRLLWGNAAYVCAVLLGQAFARDGWQLEPVDRSGLTGLPLWVHESSGETEIHPCGEKLLSDTAAEQLVTLGLMPLVSVRDQDRVRFPWIVSLQGKKLKGPW